MGPSRERRPPGFNVLIGIKYNQYHRPRQHEHEPHTPMPKQPRQTTAKITFMEHLLRQPTSKSLALAISAVLVVLGIGTGTWIGIHASLPIPKNARQGISFPLYYPRGLPQGYTVDRSSFNQKDKVVIFSIKTPRGRNIAVAEQHLPTGLDLSQHKNPAGIKLPDERSFSTGIGPAQMSLWGSKMVVSVVAPETWVILNVTNVPPEEAIAVASSFKPL
jgi:hypothetical protein